MSVSYRERQYLHSWVYVLWGFAVVALVVLFAGAGGGALLWGITGLGLLGAALVLGGSMLVSVDDRRLLISFGWLGLIRKSFDLTAVKAVHICLDNVPFAHLGRPYHAAVGGRRGVSIKCGRRRWFISAGDPLRLKSAMTKRAAIVEELPEYRRHPMSCGEPAAHRMATTCPPSLQLQSDLRGQLI